MPLPSKIIDSHHHLWTPESTDPDLGYKWLRDIGSPKPFGDPTPIQRDYLLGELLREQDMVELAASVHVQCDPGLPDPVAETRFVQQVSDDSGFDIAIIGFVDLTSIDAPATIERHCECSNFRGVRQINSRIPDRPDISFAASEYLRNDRWRENFALLSDRDLSFDLQLYPQQMQEAAEFLSKHSKVQVIIDHAGSPYDQSPGGLDLWTHGLQALAELSHISIKLSGFGMFNRSWNATSIKPLVQTILELFGHDRVMYGSNFPVDKLMATYAHGIETILEAIDSTDRNCLRALFHDNAGRVYFRRPVDGLQ